MHDFVRAQTAILLRRLAYQVNRASKKGDEEAVHDLRVAIRRLNQCLRAFSQFYPGHARKKVRHKLRDLMDAAGDVRDRDIAMRLLHQAGVPWDSPPIQFLKTEREKAVNHLAATLHHWKQHSFSRKWREGLGL